MIADIDDAVRHTIRMGARKEDTNVTAGARMFTFPARFRRIGAENWRNKLLNRPA